MATIVRTSTLKRLWKPAIEELESLSKMTWCPSSSSSSYSSPSMILLSVPAMPERSYVGSGLPLPEEVLLPGGALQPSIVEVKDKGVHVKRIKRWGQRWGKIRDSYNRKGGGYARPFAWPNDHLDRGESTQGWDKSGASGPDRGYFRATDHGVRR
eukprot:TRINITY_DN89757_c0_g1_i1.p1 TRINITY_DN89757_c0_g1~~TRINITY_DN89757_c0_g1_i1.p1  ORF type:complete len:165 (+),score=25.09 TRINITY_DN89757_c0_g1_i1:32-496(+)